MTTAATMLTAILALWAWPANALSLCPDPETGVYGPEHCDLILPFEPNPNRVECDLIDLYNGVADPICVEYWRREEERDRQLRRLLGFEDT